MFFAGDKERRNTDQHNREMKKKLLANIDDIDENLGEVKKHLACKIDELSSKIVENENSNKRKHEQCSILIEHLNDSVKGLEETLIKKIDGKIDMLIERQEKVFKSMEESRQTQNNSVEFFKTDAQELIEQVNEVSSKIMDFEKNKRNNLILFGIPDDPQESPSSLDAKVAEDPEDLWVIYSSFQIQEIFRNILLISRDIDFSKVSLTLIRILGLFAITKRDS